MYRYMILLCTFFGNTSTAPQSSLEPIEIIADVKPTTYDMPFSVYDVPPSLPMQEPAVISDESLDSNLDDFPFDITTESAVDLAKYADIATDNYDAVTEPPEGDYGINMKDPKFYSKLGYFLSPRVISDGNYGDSTTYLKEKHNAIEDKVNDVKINVTRHDNGTYDHDEFKSNDYEIVKANSSVAIIKNSVENKTNSIGNTSSNIDNNLSIVDITSRDQNERRSGDIENNNVRIEHNSFEIDENSIEVKSESGEFKSNKIGFHPNYINMRSKNAARQIPKLAKRKYRSKCRCEKIWNCPRLQITVPRCPNEYFMCCF